MERTGVVKPLPVAICVMALLLTTLAGMIHGSHIGARMEGPKGWTRWASVDVLLATAPAAAALLALGSVAIGTPHGRRRPDQTLAVWLAVAGISCSLAVLGI